MTQTFGHHQPYQWRTRAGLLLEITFSGLITVGGGGVGGEGQNQTSQISLQTDVTESHICHALGLTLIIFFSLSITAWTNPCARLDNDHLLYFVNHSLGEFVADVATKISFCCCCCCFVCGGGGGGGGVCGYVEGILFLFLYTLKIL